MTDLDPPDTEHGTLGRAIDRLVDAFGKEVAMMWRIKTGLPCEDTHIIPAMGRPHGARWNSEMDAVLWYLLRLLVTGNLVVGHSPIGDSPGLDKERQRNQEVLDRGRSRGIIATVDQGQHGAACDGWVRLEAGGGVDRTSFSITPTGDFIFTYDQVEMGPLTQDDHSIPLEIGNSEATRTLAHLRQYGAVVRWPYGSDQLILLALHGEAKELGLDAFFERDMVASQDTESALVSTISSALFEMLYQQKLMQRLSDFAEVAGDLVRELDVVAIMAARLVRQIPLAMFVHIDGEPAGQDLDLPSARVASEEDGVIKVVGRGVTVYAKGVIAQQDCANPLALRRDLPPGPHTQLMTRLNATSANPVIPVPPTRAKSFLRMASGAFEMEELEFFYEAIEELRRQGLEPSAPTPSGTADVES